LITFSIRTNTGKNRSIITHDIMNNRWDLSGKKALVTGGTRGIGLAIVHEFISLGCEVLFVARNREDIDRVISETNEKKLSGLQADVGNDKDRQNLALAVSKKWSGLDILVNNAGMNLRKPTVDYTDNEYKEIMDINISAAWYLCRLFYPLLARSEQGNIINISSVAGQTSVRSGVVYGMSKSAMIHMTKYLAVEWAGEGIRVNAIAPWYINTSLTENVLSDELYMNEVISRTPLGKTGEAADVAAAAAFLCMPAAAYITGQTLGVDGGFTALGF
jgi:tropinone reductase I